jgi:predicted nucleic acid-binding protein
MILTDTSVVIDFVRTSDARLARIISTYQAAVCGVTRAEVLNGARDPAHRQQLLLKLASFALVPIPDTAWDVVGDNLALLRRGGVTIPFPDAVIATVAIINDLELWTHDLQFQHIQRVLPALRLFQEPP